MKTVSFRNLKVGRSSASPLFSVDSASDGLTLGPGLHLIVAPNGYGKTTFLQTLAGVLPALAGSAAVNAQGIEPDRDLVYVSEYLTFPKFIYPSEWIEFMSGRSWKGDLEQELQPWIDRFLLQPRMSHYLGRMSQGERRKVTWLGAHASKKPLLLLDEPLDGLDLFGIQTARLMLQEWQKQNRIVLVVAHQVGELLDLSQELYLARDKKLLPWSRVMGLRVLDSDEFRKMILEFYRVNPALDAPLSVR